MTPKQREAMHAALDALATATGTLDSYYATHALPIFETAEQLLREALAEPDTPDGWKLVPIEPTEKMIDEGAQGMASFDEGTSWPESFDKLQVKRMRMDAKKAWRYMIAAAPEYKE